MKNIIFICLFILSPQLQALEIDNDCKGSLSVKRNKTILNIPNGQGPYHKVLEAMMGQSCMEFELARGKVFLNNDIFIKMDGDHDFENELDRLRNLLSESRGNVTRDLVYRVAAGVSVLSTVYCLTGEPILCTAAVVSGLAAYTRLTDMQALKKLNKQITTLEMALKNLQKQRNTQFEGVLNNKIKLLNDMCQIVKSNCV